MVAASQLCYDGGLLCVNTLHTLDNKRPLSTTKTDLQDGGWKTRHG